MITQQFLTCGQLYKLFGFKKTIAANLDYIFDFLLYSISTYSEEIEYPDHYYGVQYLPEKTIVSIYGNLQETCTKLEKYLEAQAPYKSMLRLDTQMRMIDVKLKELSATNLFHLKERWNKRKELSEMKGRQIPIEDVFGYLRYRSNQEHISKEELRKKFCAFAQSYPANRV